jgi:hypothetical protein
MSETRIGGQTFEGLQASVLGVAENLERLLTAVEKHDEELARLERRLAALEDETEGGLHDERDT